MKARAGVVLCDRDNSIKPHLHTPCCLLYTRSGAPTALSPDILSQIPEIEAVHLSLADLYACLLSLLVLVSFSSCTLAGASLRTHYLLVINKAFVIFSISLLILWSFRIVILWLMKLVVRIQSIYLCPQVLAKRRCLCVTLFIFFAFVVSCAFLSFFLLLSIVYFVSLRLLLQITWNYSPFSDVIFSLRFRWGFFKKCWAVVRYSVLVAFVLSHFLLLYLCGCIYALHVLTYVLSGRCWIPCFFLSL